MAPAGVAPEPRANASAVYDAARERMLIFGGQGRGQNFKDVYALTLGPSPAWSRLDAEGRGPSARAHATAIYDPVRDRVLLFGGRNYWPQTWLSDVWELTLSGTPTWGRLEPNGSPPPAAKGQAVYDPALDRMILFQGDQGAQHISVWKLTLGEAQAWWSALAVSGTPPSYSPFRAFNAVLDSRRDRIVVTPASALTLGKHPAWIPLDADPIVFVDWPGITTIYDPVRDRLVMYGGVWYEAGIILTLDLGNPVAWSSHSYPGAPPPGRIGATAIRDPIRRRMIMFGGAGWNDTWAMALTGPPIWTQLSPAGTPPPPRAGHTAIYDPLRDRMIVFAGYDVVWWNNPLYFPRNDLWALSLGDSPTWTPIAAAGEPPPPSGFVASYDAANDRMVVSNGPGAWALSLSGEPTWSTLPLTGTSPSPRIGLAAIGDWRRNRLLLFGGMPRLEDTWSLSLGTQPTWENMAAGSPQYRPWASAIHDRVGDRMIVFGGWRYGDDCACDFCECYGARGDTWALDLTGSSSWTELSPTAFEGCGGDSAGAMYDPEQDRMIVTSGRTTSALTWGRIHSVSVAIDPGAVNLRSHGFWLLVSIEPADFDPATIETGSVRVQELIAPDPGFAVLGDRDGDGVPDLTLRFRRERVMDLLQSGAVDLTIEGSFTGGEYFRGTGGVRALSPGVKRRTQRLGGLQ
jgi:hypothetical protein